MLDDLRIRDSLKKAARSIEDAQVLLPRGSRERACYAACACALREAADRPGAGRDLASLARLAALYGLDIHLRPDEAAQILDDHYEPTIRLRNETEGEGLPGGSRED